MGDRCHMMLEFGGSIRGERALRAVIEALQDDGAQINDLFEPQSIRRYILDCGLTGKNPSFFFEEINYAKLGAFNRLAERGLDVYAWNSAGDDYLAGNQSYNGVTCERFAWEEADEGKIGIEDIAKIMAMVGETAEAKLNTIEFMCAGVMRGQWKALRPLVVAKRLMADVAEEAKA